MIRPRRMKISLALIGAVAGLGGCRTEVRPVVKSAPPVRARMVETGECVVHDYPSAVDVPAGSVNIGWVIVPRKEQESDDDTFERLRQAVCAKGGTALSQAHWNRPPGASVADPPAELEANAWTEP
jgi:hypothetical protein